ncbi:MAG: FAD-dependent oxidoreductase, partial [Acetobacterales bacterium]
MHLARRAFLAGAGTLLAAPASAQIQEQAQGGPDVVVVGAGLAGLAAARGLILEGFRVQVIEARDRVGGRAWTASGALGVPFDRGAARLYDADGNPLSDLIRHLGFLPVSDAERPRLYLDGVPASAARVEAIERAMARLTDAMAEAAEKDRDVSAALLASGDDRWQAIAAALTGPLAAGVELTDLAVLDWYRQAGTENGAVLAEGLGTAVTAFGQGLPVRLRTAAQSVKWDGRGVTVVTEAGEIAARAVVLTAPTPVLDHGIRFDPVLP